MSDGNGVIFRAKNKALAERAVKLLGEERPMTLRQLYYRLISAGALANSQKEYNRVKNVMKVLREKRQVPRTWLVDNVRATDKPSSWSGLADFAESVRECYRKDFWASLPAHVEVFVEKDAVAGTIQPVTREFDIHLRVMRGYASISYAGEIADLWRQIKKPIHAYYLGDFDPSGFDLERDMRDKLDRYSDRDDLETLDPDEREEAKGFWWTRLAVRREDFAAHGLVRLPVKKKDARTKAFVRVHGRDCAEMDALPPTELRRRVREAILSHIDVGRWERLQETERLEQETLDAFISGLGPLPESEPRSTFSRSRP